MRAYLKNNSPHSVTIGNGKNLEEPKGQKYSTINASTPQEHCHRFMRYIKHAYGTNYGVIAEKDC